MRHILRLAGANLVQRTNLGPIGHSSLQRLARGCCLISAWKILCPRRDSRPIPTQDWCQPGFQTKSEKGRVPIRSNALASKNGSQFPKSLVRARAEWKDGTPPQADPVAQAVGIHSSTSALIGRRGFGTTRGTVERGHLAGCSDLIERDASIETRLERKIGSAAVDCAINEHVLCKEAGDAVAPGSWRARPTDGCGIRRGRNVRGSCLCPCERRLISRLELTNLQYFGDWPRWAGLTFSRGL